MKNIILIIIILLMEPHLFAKEVTAVLIPPTVDSRISYSHTFPFNLMKGETFSQAVERVFYALFIRKIKSNTDITKVVIKEPDVYPYYTRVRPDDDADFAQFIEVPSTTFTFKFGDYKPDYIIQMDSLTISSSVEASGDGMSGAGSIVTALGGVVVGMIVDRIIDGTTEPSEEDNIATGDFNIFFKYFIWDNKKYKVIRANYCDADEHSEDPTREEWYDIIDEVVENVFEDTGFK